MLNIVSPSTIESHWLPGHVAGIRASDLPTIPIIRASDVVEILPGFQLWDCWPVELPDGCIYRHDDAALWVIMCAPRVGHPDERHDIARLRLMMERDGGWKDCGYLLPDGLNPGSREWAGSSVYDPDQDRMTLFYTAAGRRGVTGQSFEQRLFQTHARLGERSGLPCFTDWSVPTESVVADGATYLLVDHTVGVPGNIKGFRDPSHFRDPATGEDYLLFTASLPGSAHDHNGAIGIARAIAPDFGGWAALPPLISADGVNNELERPVMRVKDGHYYVFWSTQSRTFAPGPPAGPNGLYGMVAEHPLGPYRPLNGTGLVAANPPEEPVQTYSWWVTQDFEVAGFVDYWGLNGRTIADHPELAISHFGGALAPRFSLAINGDRAQISGA